MNRAEIISFCQDERGEVDGTPGHASPFGWDRLVNFAADDIARKTRIYYVECTLPVIKGQAQYCAPPIDRIIGARIKSAEGDNISAIFADASDRFSMRGYPDYDEPNGTPRIIAALGANTIRLTPTPDFATDPAGPSAGGVYMEGYGHPADTWPSDDDECPLPEKAHQAVIWHACASRSRRMKDYAAMQAYEGHLQKELNQLSRDMMVLTPLTMSRQRLALTGGAWARW